nr:flagellin [Selenomonas ruminantium]
MEEVDNALQYLLNVNTLLGSQCSRFEAFSQIKETQIYGVENAESVIRDADMAKELTNYTKQNVLSQASQAVLAQANQKSFDVLSLLK